MTANSARIALYYDDSGYREALDSSAKARPGAPAGLMGRQVAGKEFLDAYLNYGTWAELAALTPNHQSGQSLLRTCREHPSAPRKQRRLRLFETREFTSRFLPDPPADVLYFPCPADIRYAWARQGMAEPGYALCGVTHTLCSTRTLRTLCDMVTAPFERFDRLICTSRAVVDMARTVTNTYADYLHQRHGGDFGLRIGLELLPLGVEVDRFRPPTPEERAAQRSRLGIASDETAVLFVGRLSHHAKAHPFPMFRGLSRAAEMTGRKVCLVLSGWASGPAVKEAFQRGARSFAENVRVLIVDGTDPNTRFSVWRAADVFTSLSDNIQETFGLVIVEAMASGLPVVASDWNGYRDLVVDGQTGFLVPTWMVRDATAELTTQLLVGETDYDHFLARSNQAVSVDVAAASEAYARLLADVELRRRMGEAGRRRAEKVFAWSGVIRAYEELWERQQAERLEFLAEKRSGRKAYPGSAAYPPPEHTFAGYPTAWLKPPDMVRSDPQAADRLAELLAAPLTNYESTCRCGDPGLLRTVIREASAGCRLAHLESLFQEAGVWRGAARATLAWLLKYDLLQRVTHGER